jgi:hypothetical protein
MHKILIRQSIAIGFAVAIACCQSPAWGTAGFAESESGKTPGGYLIGNNDAMPPHKGTAIYRYPGDSAVYVDNIEQYGFYDGVVIGKTDRQFFLFDESKQTVGYFADREQLCSTIKAKNLKFNNALTFFKGSDIYDYYVIQLSLYFLVPFLVLLVIPSLFNRNIPRSQSIERTLKSKFFALQVYVLSVCTNVAFMCHITDGSDTIFLTWVLSAIGLAVVMIPLWIFGRLFLRIFTDEDSIYWKCFTFVLILTIGLAMTIGHVQAPWTSIKYFLCQ